MKTDNKYYTPEISEFHVGFEHEVNHKVRDGSGDREWCSELYKGSSEQTRYIKYLLEEEPENIRVKYLDKEDIESFGFTIKSDYGAGTTFHLNNSYSLQTHKHAGISYNEHEVRIFKSGIIGKPCRIFTGDIKNKSELKKLLQQLGI